CHGRGVGGRIYPPPRLEPLPWHVTPTWSRQLCLQSPNPDAWSCGIARLLVCIDSPYQASNDRYRLRRCGADGPTRQGCGRLADSAVRLLHRVTVNGRDLRRPLPVGCSTAGRHPALSSVAPPVETRSEEHTSE